MIGGSFHYWISQFKHPSYSEEKEWRLVYHRYSNEKEQAKNPGVWPDGDLIFRCSGNNIVPYLTIPFGEKRNMRKYIYPIKKVIIGSTHEQEICEEGLRRFLVSNRKKSVKIQRSSIPLRDM
ncbi:hypothetical protein JCM17960_26640 [Magnetospira thiophila]